MLNRSTINTIESERQMKRVLFLVAFSILVPSVLHAQTVATPGNKYAWDQDASDLATAQAFTYKDYTDALAPVVLTPVTCSGTISPFQCIAPMPLKPAGSHSTSLTASDVAGESLPSTPLAFVFVVVPNPPKNLRIVK